MSEVKENLANVALSRGQRIRKEETRLPRRSILHVLPRNRRNEERETKKRGR